MQNKENILNGIEDLIYIPLKCKDCDFVDCDGITCWKERDAIEEAATLKRELEEARMAEWIAELEVERNAEEKIEESLFRY